MEHATVHTLVSWTSRPLDTQDFNVHKSSPTPAKFTVSIWKKNFKPTLDVPFTLKSVFEKGCLIIFSALKLFYLRSCWNLVPKLHLESYKNSRNAKTSYDVDLLVDSLCFETIGKALSRFMVGYNLHQAVFVWGSMPIINVWHVLAKYQCQFLTWR